MRINLKGRNIPVDNELRERVDKKFAKISRQVSDLAELEVEVYEERNPSIRENQVVEVTLHRQGDHAARVRALRGHGPLGQSRRRGHRAPGEEAPRQAAPPPRGAPGLAAACFALIPRFLRCGWPGWGRP